LPSTSKIAAGRHDDSLQIQDTPAKLACYPGPNDQQIRQLLGSIMENISVHLSGAKLYGDDFGRSEIDAWFADEKEGYADLGAKDADAYSYHYHALNHRHGLRFLEGRKFKNALGFGSAYGDELKSAAPDIGHITIVDPSDAFHRTEIFGTPASFVKPLPDGTLPFPTGTFDLATCLGVLHHIPNVSFVMSELARVMADGGHLLVREPIVSMGDWRKPRRGLTKRERGIPLHLLRTIAETSGFTIVHQALCMFPATPRIFKFTQAPYNSGLAVSVDSILCSLFAWNVNYHPATKLQLLRPTSGFLVLRKGAATT
jgi:SAM-dependent methyltransferase